MPSVCFFCRTDDPEILERVDFYAHDLRILKELGLDVRIATRASEIVSADLYFVWWWTWAFLPITYARMRGKPAIVTGAFDYWLYPGRSIWQRWFHRYALKNASANVFISRVEYDSVTQALPTNNPVCSPLGVDVDRFAPTALARAPFVLTIAGSGMDHGNSSRKCIPELIRSAPLTHREHPDIRFVIVGKKGSDFPALQALAREVGADTYIDFPGVISDDDKVSLLRSCSVYLQPSRYEGFGLSVLEAMSCGAPVVTNSAGALREVGGDAVRYAADQSPESIAKATNALLDSAGERQALSGKARARAVELFTIQRRRNDLERVIASVVPALSPIARRV